MHQQDWATKSVNNVRQHNGSFEKKKKTQWWNAIPWEKAAKCHNIEKMPIYNSSLCFPSSTDCQEIMLALHCSALQNISQHSRDVNMRDISFERHALGENFLLGTLPMLVLCLHLPFHLALHFLMELQLLRGMTKLIMNTHESPIKYRLPGAWTLVLCCQHKPVLGKSEKLGNKKNASLKDAGFWWSKLAEQWQVHYG